METQTIKAKSVMDVIQDLKQNPFLYFSGGSKELFHSNFLQWLLLSYGDFITPKVLMECLHHDLNLEIDQDNLVKREFNNIDLFIPCKNQNVIIIENKVKSLPSKYQLERYSADTVIKNSKKKKDKKTNYHFVLLAFIKPSYFDKNNEWKSEGLIDYKNNKSVISNTKWLFISYWEIKKLACYLLNLNSHENEFNKEVLTNYIKFIEQLYIIQNEATIHDINVKYLLKKGVATKLKGVRLHDLYGKINFDSLAECIYLELNKLGLKGLLAFGEEKQALKEGKFLIHSGYQRAGPLVNIEFLYSGKTKEDGTVFEIQIQNNNFCLHLASFSKKSVKNMTSIVPKLFEEKLWFEFYKKYGFLKENIKSVERKGYSITLKNGKVEKFGKFGGDGKSYLALRKAYKITDDITYDQIIEWVVLFSKQLIKLYKNKKLKKYIDSKYF